MMRDALSPRLFPGPWASAWGEDKFGLWISLDLHGVVQRFRWCEPGLYLMGSPEDEPERYDDWETQHEVTLTQGFWLADTAVTQALWETVMGGNPCSFKGPERPVENVCWEEAQQFIRKINKLIPGLAVRLPWEAEWEYACRAGTTTPFSFGKNITPEQVNFDGSSPYANGRRGWCRRETVEVKSLPCNNWGLYEMHGNIWEWCGDFWEADLGIAPVVDPRGLKRGGYRVYRGGSWSSDGRFVRSAIRNRRSPSLRNSNLGFRLARGN